MTYMISFKSKLCNVGIFVLIMKADSKKNYLGKRRTFFKSAQFGRKSQSVHENKHEKLINDP